MSFELNTNGHLQSSCWSIRTCSDNYKSSKNDKNHFDVLLLI